jgi:AcrR family transcriptional regulator
VPSRTRPPVPDTVRLRDGHRSGPVKNTDRQGRQGGHVAGMQRRRLLTATVEVVFERGAHGASVGLVSERAGVSRKTFYEIFEGREGCLLAAFQEGVSQATEAVRRAAVDEKQWAARIRLGLTALLSFLENEPAIGRLLIVEALAAGPPTLNERRRVLEQIITLIDQGREATKASQRLPPMTAEGVLGAVLSVIHARMLARSTPTDRDTRGEERPLTELAGSLMAMIVGPYLGATAARKELDRPTPTASRPTPKLPTDPFKDLSIRLTYRTARVLTSIANTPGSSSKQVATNAGIADEGQTSRLLTRLQNAGLIQNTGGQPTNGEPKAWNLTQRGRLIQQAVGQG